MKHHQPFVQSTQYVTSALFLDSLLAISKSHFLNKIRLCVKYSCAINRLSSSYNVIGQIAHKHRAICSHFFVNYQVATLCAQYNITLLVVPNSTYCIIQTGL